MCVCVCTCVTGRRCTDQQCIDACHQALQFRPAARRCWNAIIDALALPLHVAMANKRHDTATTTSGGPEPRVGVHMPDSLDTSFCLSPVPCLSVAPPVDARPSLSVPAVWAVERPLRIPENWLGPQVLHGAVMNEPVAGERQTGHVWMWVCGCVAM